MLKEYKDKYKIKIGLLPTRRRAFSVEEAGRFKRIIEDKVNKYGTDLLNIDFLNNEGLIFNRLDADKVADKFIAEKVDAVFAPHCNFGTEDAVAMVAKKVGKPLLVWGPQDDAPMSNGIRMRDTQCGLFATTKVLGRYGVPFTYITNCRIEDEIFDRGYRNFLSAASVVKTFRNLRIGQIDTRPGAFLSVMFNESEILERFGIETVPISLVDVENEVYSIMKDNCTEYREIIDEYRSRFKKICFDEESLNKVAALKLAIRKWARAEELSALGIQCWDAMQTALGIYPCFINGEITDDGLPVACETDVLGAVSAAMLQAAKFGETPVFFADITVRHPDNPNAELLWHCGNFPYSLAKNTKDTSLELQFGGKCPTAGRWEIKGGDITLCKFDGLNGEYKLLMGHCKGTTGPKNVGTYLWAEFNDWPKWEHRFIYGPYIHHVAGIHGLASPALYEACRYIPGLIPDPVEPGADEIEKYLRG